MNAQDSSIRMALAYGRAHLRVNGSYARDDAELLLRHVLGRDRAWILAHLGAELTSRQVQRYEELLARRARHEPIQYILGEREFFGLPLTVTPAVLIPRPETEHLVEAVLARLPQDRPIKIADVGTGSGAIALALASRLPLARIDALDLSAEALAVAEMNAHALHLAQNVRFLQSDLLASVRNEFYSCIVSNPPYVATWEVLEPQVALWEPHAALFAGTDGLEIYRALLPQAAAQLVPGGLFAVEFGAGQHDALAALFGQDPRWTFPVLLPDLQGLARVACSVLLPNGQ